MKTILTSLIIIIWINGNSQSLNLSLSTGISQKYMTSSVGGSVKYKNIQGGVFDVIPLTNNSDRNWLCVGYFGYDVGGGIVPYVSIRGGGVMYQNKRLVLNAGISQYNHDKPTAYLLAGVNFNPMKNRPISYKTATLLLCGLSGMFSGLSDVANYHPNAILANYPKLNPNWWYPPMAWHHSDWLGAFKNVGHFSDAGRRVTLVAAGIVYGTHNDFRHLGSKVLTPFGKMPKWCSKLIDIGGMALVERIGHNIVYNVMFKN